MSEGVGSGGVNVPISGAEETSSVEVLGVMEVEGSVGCLEDDELPVKGIRMRHVKSMRHTKREEIHSGCRGNLWQRLRPKVLTVKHNVGFSLLE